jgi:inhibitor of KinA sporulation pathway (predicted exonuclease)
MLVISRPATGIGVQPVVGSPILVRQDFENLVNQIGQARPRQNPAQANGGPQDIRVVDIEWFEHRGYVWVESPQVVAVKPDADAKTFRLADLARSVAYQAATPEGDHVPLRRPLG